MDKKTVKDVLLGIGIVAIIGLLSINTFVKPQSEAEPLSGTYYVTYCTESTEEAELRVAERYNSGLNRISFTPDGTFYQFRGVRLIKGEYERTGDVLKLGDEEYKVEEMPGGMILDGGTYLKVALFRGN